MAEDINDEIAKFSFSVEPSNGDGQLSRKRGDTQEFTQESIDRSRKAILEIGEQFSDVLEKMPAKCEHLDLKFGLKFDAEAGVWLAKVGTQASFEVTLRITSKD